MNRNKKEKLLGQKAKVIWITGLPSAGKTTLAYAIEKELLNKGFISQVLDGDFIRKGINKNLGFSAEDRKENIRRVAEISKIFIDSGLILINSFISPTNEIRNLAKEIIGEKNFLEIFVNTSIKECIKRDVKGLYKKAINGDIKDFTGIDAKYENPENPFIEIKTEQMTVEESVEYVLNKILPIIENK